MTFNEYNVQAKSTVQYRGTPQECLSYVSVALGGEVGEYLNEYKKYLRGVPNKYDSPQGEQRQRMLLELGDTLWYLSQAASELGSTLDHVAQMNIEKLATRHNRKVE